METRIRLRLETREPFADGLSFGDVGPYERLVGRMFFAVNPEAPAYHRVADLGFAPRNAAGEDHLYPSDQFPFAYTTSTDPFSGQTDGILKRPTTDPVVIHTQTASEYWQHRGSLVHTDALGHDLVAPIAPRPRRLVLPVDGSAHALEMARRLGQRVGAAGAAMVFLYVHKPDGLTPEPTWRDSDTQRRRDLERRLAAERIVAAINAALGRRASAGRCMMASWHINRRLTTYIWWAMPPHSVLMCLDAAVRWPSTVMQAGSTKTF